MMSESRTCNWYRCDKGKRDTAVYEVTGEHIDGKTVDRRYCDEHAAACEKAGFTVAPKNR